MAKKKPKKIIIVGLLILILAAVGIFYYKDDTRLKSVKVDDPEKYAETKMKDDAECNKKIEELQLNFGVLESTKDGTPTVYQLSCQPKSGAVKAITGSDSVPVSFKLIMNGLKVANGSGDFACSKKGSDIKLTVTGSIDGAYLELIPQQSFNGTKKSDGSYYKCMAKPEKGYGYVMFQPVESSGGLFGGTIDASNPINNNIDLSGYDVPTTTTTTSKDDENENVDKVDNSRIDSGASISTTAVQINPHLLKDSADYENYNNQSASATFKKYEDAYKALKSTHPEKTFSAVINENEDGVNKDNIKDGKGNKVGKISLTCEYALSHDDIVAMIGYGDIDTSNYNDTYLDESGKLSKYYYDDYDAENPNKNTVFNTTYFYGEKTISKSHNYEFHLNTGDKNHNKATTIDGQKATCKRICKEVVKVDYGPPVAIKAGMCFEYRVKVSSIVQCEADTTGTVEPSVPEACLPTPTCWSTALKQEMKVAGPTEDFQACVQDCDGGKYTDKCSTSCYKKVYGESKNSNINTTKTVNPTPLANEKLPPFLNSELGNCVEGQYYRDGSKLNWCQFEYQPSHIGNWHITDEEVSNQSDRQKLYARSAIFYGRTNYTWKTYSGRYQTTTVQDKYVSGAAGILRGFYNDSECHDSCHWMNIDAYNKSSCDGKYLYFDYSYYRNLCSILGDASLTDKCMQQTQIPTYQQLTGVTKGDFKYADSPVPNVSELRRLDKLYNLEIKQKTIEECEAATTCNKTESTYEIQFNYTVKGGTKVEVVKPMSQKLKNPEGNAHETKGDILLSYGGCYASKKDLNRWYQSEWTIPGTWVSLKGHKISFEDKSNDNSWGYQRGRICLPTNINPTNAKWALNFYKATEAINNPKYTTNWEFTEESDPNKAFNTTNNTYDGYNIFAESQSFGHFNWDFSISCFWAYSNGDPTVECEGDSCNKGCGDDGIECTCKGDKDNCTKKNSDEGYTIRSFDSNDPVLDGTKVQPKVLDGDRAIPFNWSKGATMEAFRNVPGGYGINPEEYLNNEIKGKDLFADEPDLTVTLTKENIREIRKYNKDHRGTSGYKFEGTVTSGKPVTGVTYYQSPFIYKSNYMTLGGKYGNNFASLRGYNNTSSQ